MPEPGELITVTRVFGVESIISSIGGLTSTIEQLTRSVVTMTGALDDFKANVSGSLTNIADGVVDIQRRLDEALADKTAAIDAAKAEQLQAIRDDLQPLADQARALADSVPDAPAPEPTPEPGPAPEPTP